MTELTCWPLDNHEYTAQALGAAYAARSRGILHASDFAASTNADNTITIAPGVGCVHVNDYWAAFPYMLQPALLQLEDADGVMPRWDAIALTYDKNANKAGLTVRTGQPGTSPQLPEIRRDDNYDEIYLYRITRPVGATAITADHVVDLRADESFCGLMRDTVDAIDTSVMQAAFNVFLDKVETELSQLHAGTATMLRADYDSNGAVAEAGGIKAYTDERLQPVQTSLSNLLYPNAGAHNAVYRGKFLGNTVTAAQYAAIKAGTFDDLYIGDYWTIGDVNYRIAAFDYFLNAGDTECTDHHAVIVPDTCLYRASMNSTDTANGGYVDSAMYKSNLEQAKTIIKSAFSGHVLNHRVYLVNAVTNGAPSAGAWVGSEVDLMTERMVYGCPVYSPMTDGQKNPWTQMENCTVEKSQLPLFWHDHSRICNRDSWWLRDVVYSYGFAYVTDRGNAYFFDASYSNGVRPYFCIY